MGVNCDEELEKKVEIREDGVTSGALVATVICWLIILPLLLCCCCCAGVYFAEKDMWKEIT